MHSSQKGPPAGDSADPTRSLTRSARRYPSGQARPRPAASALLLCYAMSVSLACPAQHEPGRAGPAADRMPAMPCARVYRRQPTACLRFGQWVAARCSYVMSSPPPPQAHYTAQRSLPPVHRPAQKWEVRTQSPSFFPARVTLVTSISKQPVRTLQRAATRSDMLLWSCVAVVFSGRWFARRAQPFSVRPHPLDTHRLLIQPGRPQDEHGAAWQPPQRGWPRKRASRLPVRWGECLVATRKRLRSCILTC